MEKVTFTIYDNDVIKYCNKNNIKDITLLNDIDNTYICNIGTYYKIYNIFNNSISLPIYL